MQTVLLVIHLMIAVALIGAILLQRSEGGALGIGGGGGGGFMSGRGTANALTRLTAMLAAGFFVTCIALTFLARFDHPTRSIIDTIGKPPAASLPAPASTTGSTAPVPPATAPAASTTTAPDAGTASQGKQKLPDLEPIIPAANEPSAKTPAPAPAADAATQGKSKLPDLEPIIPPATGPATAAPAANLPAGGSATTAPAATATPGADAGKSKLPDLAPIIPADPGTPAKQ